MKQAIKTLMNEASTPITVQRSSGLGKTHVLVEQARRAELDIPKITLTRSVVESAGTKLHRKK